MIATGWFIGRTVADDAGRRSGRSLLAGSRTFATGAAAVRRHVGVQQRLHDGLLLGLKQQCRLERSFQSHVLVERVLTAEEQLVAAHRQRDGELAVRGDERRDRQRPLRHQGESLVQRRPRLLPLH